MSCAIGTDHGVTAVLKTKKNMSKRVFFSSFQMLLFYGCDSGGKKWKLFPSFWYAAMQLLM